MPKFGVNSMNKKDKLAAAPGIRKDPTAGPAVKAVFDSQLLAQEKYIIELEAKLKEQERTIVDTQAELAEATKERDTLNAKLDAGKAERKTKHVHILMRPSLYAKIEAIAKEKGLRSVAPLFEEVMMDYVNSRTFLVSQTEEELTPKQGK